MADLWAMLLALAAIVLPLGVAGWLLGRRGRGGGEHETAARDHGKIPPP